MSPDIPSFQMTDYAPLARIPRANGSKLDMWRSGERRRLLLDLRAFRRRRLRAPTHPNYPALVEIERPPPVFAEHYRRCADRESCRRLLDLERPPRNRLRA